MNTIIPWLEHLNVLMPPRNISLVGAGNGKGIWAQWLAHQASKSRVTFIEAEPLQYSTLQRTLDLLGERAQHCEIRNIVVAAQQGTASFFVTNSQQESGLLEPRSLLSLWPNLQTEEVKELSAITLDALFSDLSEDAEQPMGEGHWLVIDCLPAGALLRASSKLDLVDVVIARVLLGEMHAMPDGTSLEEVAEFLQQNGMVQIAVEATRHPDIGYALFVRDVRAAFHAQVQKHHSETQKLRFNGDEKARLLQESLSKVEQLAQAKLLVEQQSQERHAQIEQLTQAKAAAEKQSQERAQQLEQLGKARDEQAKLAQERHAHIEQLTQAKAAAEKQSQERAQQLEQLGKARDEQAKLAQERHAQIEQLTQAKAAAEKQSQERAQQLEQLTKARDEQAKLAQERRAQVEQLTQAKAAAEKQSLERGQQLEQLAKAHDEEAIKMRQEYKAQIEQLTLTNTPSVKTNSSQKDEIDALAKSLSEEKNLNRSWNLRFQDIEIKNIDLGKKSDQLRKSLEELQSKYEKEKKYSSDADIDDFLNDISPFFYNRSLTYVDVGAYIGEVYLKLQKSKLLRVREAHLFEPNPVSYKDLEKNVLEVNLTKLHTYNHALGAEDKELSLSPAKSMSKVFPSVMHVDQSKRIESIQCHTLDGLVDLFTDRHIDLLKIDVEGYELDVLRGAEKIFEEQLADVIYIEVGFRRDGTQQTYFGDIDNFFQSYGYRIFKIYEQKNEWIQDSPLLRRCNFAYMSSAFSAANPFKVSQELMELKERLKKNNASHEDK